jgi:cation/acetate symporter
MHKAFKMQMSDHAKVFAGRATAIGVGIIAMVLGGPVPSMNVSFPVGWAFAIAASANLPAIFGIIFWKKATSKGIGSLHYRRTGGVAGLNPVIPGYVYVSLQPAEC